jgi:cap3/cap4 methyltransferase
MSNRYKSSNGTSLPHCNRDAEKGMKLSPYVNLSPDAPQLPYSSRDAKALRGLNVHQGQRKLLMSEIQLLTLYYSKKTVHPWLVYVGSAPGTHLLFLHKLFPQVRFSLWDGAPFDVRLKDVKFDDGRPVFEIHREFFTDQTCSKILSRLDKDQVDEKNKGNKAIGQLHMIGGGKTPLIFVSDIRSAEPNHEAFEAKVMFDMLAQKRWVTLLKPDLSLLKFRLPFTLKEGDTVPYLDGKLYYGIWPPHESAETRLLIKKSDISKPEIQVDYVTYERVMFHHNAVTRRTCFDLNKAPASEFADLLLPGPGKPEIGYCRCYDCLSEIAVYNTYLKDAATNAQAVSFAKGKLVDLLIAAQSANRDMSKHINRQNSSLND